MVLPLVPYKLEKLVKKQHTLQVGIKCRQYWLWYHGGSEEWGSVIPQELAELTKYPL